MKTRFLKLSAYFLTVISVFIVGIEYANAESTSISFCSDNGNKFVVTGNNVTVEQLMNRDGTDTEFARNIANMYEVSGIGRDGKEYSYGGYSVVVPSYTESSVTDRCFKLADIQSTSVATSNYSCGSDRLYGTTGAMYDSIEFVQNAQEKINGKGRVILSFKNNSYLKKYLTNANINNGTFRFQMNMSGTASVSGTNLVISNVSLPEIGDSTTFTIITLVNWKTGLANGNDHGIYLGMGDSSKVLSDTELASKMVRSTGNATQDFERYCGDTLYLTESNVAVETLSDNIRVTNNHLTSTMCDQVRNYTNAPEDFKRSYIPQCYNSTVGFLENRTAQATIARRYENLKAWYDPMDESRFLRNKENLNCLDSQLGIPSDSGASATSFEKTNSYTEMGKYWGIVCTEEYYVEPDNPQLTYAGGGVTYSNKVEIRRNCRIVLRQVVSKKAQCVATTDVNCHLVDNAFSWGDVHTTGPNEDFDECINTCDNGSYTQKCINKCYKEVYGEDRSVSLKSNAKTSSYVNNSEKEEKNAVFNPTTHEGEDSPMVKPLDHGCKGKPECYSITCDGGNSVEVGVSAWCRSAKGAGTHGGTQCDITCSVGPDGCSWNPDGEYQEELALSKAEYTKYVNILKDQKYAAPIKEYTISYKDSYDGQIYKVTGSTTKEISGAPSLVINKDNELSRVFTPTDGDYEYVSYGSETTERLQTTIRSTVVYNIDLPTEYTLKNDANTILVKGIDGYYKKVNDGSGTYKFERYAVKDEKTLSKGESVYYTSFDSRDTNVKVETEQVRSSKILNASTNPNSLLGLISKTTELKEQLGTNVTRQQFLDFWNANKDYFTSYSSTPYVAYIEQGELVVKSLQEKVDNIRIDFEIGTLGDVYKAGGTIKSFNPSGYNCYYGVYNMIKNDTPDTGKGGLRYYYHEINLEDVFDNREPRWNWTGTITGNKVTGAAAKIDGYIVDPEKLIASIESKGYNIYTDEGTQSQELDYSWNLDYKTITTIRNYNKTMVNGKKISYTDFSLAGSNNGRGENYSTKVKEWLGSGFTNQSLSITQCNNSLAGSCYNYNIGGK